MPTPKIIVIAPQKERQALRSCGVLPDRCFRDVVDDTHTPDGDHFSPVCLWPYDIKYTGTAPLVENLKQIPPDVPAFLGLGIAESDDQLKENELAIAALFGAIIVHIVFLDERIGSRGYAKLNPLEAISEWGMNFRKAMDTRFPNEYYVRFENHILVLISPHNQVSATEEDLQRFRACLAPGSGVFSSCYFLNYNLRIGKSKELFYSMDVWSVMVSRLIMAFMLSQGSDIHEHFWKDHGIKVWNAQECLLSIEKDSGTQVIDEAFKKTFSLIQEKVVAHHDKNGFEERLKIWSSPSHTGNQPEAIDPIKPDYATVPNEPPEWRTLPKGGWSDFDAKLCVENTADDNHWKNSSDVRQLLVQNWINENPPTDFSPFVNDLFENVKRSSALLFCGLDILSDQMQEAGNRKKGTEDEFKALAQTEQQRRKVLEDIKDEAVEMGRAQAHYVGYGMGVFITVVIALMFGWVIWRITQLLGGGVVMPIVLTGAIWAGSLLAMLMVLGFHSKRGKIGVNHIISQSIAADRLMVQRDQHARNILVQSIETRDELNINAIRFRVWALLKRTQSILQTELQPYSPVIWEALGHVPEVGTSSVNAQRDKFLAKTRKTIGPFSISDGSFMKKDIEALADEAVFGKQANQLFKDEPFCKRWKRICNTDCQNMGYHPAKLFIDEVHSFVLQYLEKLIQVMDRHVIEKKRMEIQNELMAWFEAIIKNIKNDGFAHFATAAIDGTQLNDELQFPCFVFIKEAWIENLPDDYNRNGIAVKSSTAMEIFPILALRYQEYRLDFALTDEGLLTFKEVEND